jgi:RNA polymerase sigma factor (sigma-70 family)
MRMARTVPPARRLRKAAGRPGSALQPVDTDVSHGLYGPLAAPMAGDSAEKSALDTANREGRPDEAATAELAVRLNGRYRTALMSYFLRRTRHRQDAEDLTQEVLLRILARGEGMPLENPEVFLFSIAGNLLRDRARRAQTHRAGLHDSLDRPAEDFHGPAPFVSALVEDRGPERVLVSQETLAEALRALDDLGERTRDIFMLFRLEKMKHRDIATLYGISVSAVEKHVARAGLHLSRLFGPL